jgi:hypothetical protein
MPREPNGDAGVVGRVGGRLGAPVVEGSPARIPPRRAVELVPLDRAVHVASGGHVADTQRDLLADPGGDAVDHQPTVG